MANCSICNKQINATDSYSVVDAMVLCEQCALEHVRACYRCGSVIFDEHGVHAIGRNNEDRLLCSHCGELYTYVCYDCGNRYYKRENIRGIGRDNQRTVNLCESCTNDNTKWRICSECGYFVRCNNFDTEVVSVCNGCASTYKFNRVLHKYSYKPEPNFIGESPDNLFYGIELEVCSPDEQVRNKTGVALIKDFSDDERFFYLKPDSSIPNYGFEIVSHPMTLDFHRQFWHDTLLLYCRDSGMVSHFAPDAGCGLHVHVSRNALSSNDWIKVDWFINKNRRIVEKIARRAENYYSTFINSEENHTYKFKRMYGKPKGERYYAVNFNNRNTVEFRMFRGTLKYETFIASLEFVDAVVNWSKTVKVCDLIASHKISWNCFSKYVKANSEKYKHLMSLYVFR